VTRMSVPQAVELARQQLREGDLAKGEAICRQILAQQPQNSEVVNLLGAISMSRGDCNAAISYFDASLCMDPNQSYVHCNRALALQALQRLPEAVQAARRATELSPEFPQAHNHLGLMLFAAGQTEESIAEFGRALAINPDFADGYNNLGNAYKDMGDIAKSLECYRRGAKLDPDSIFSQGNLLMALHYDPDADAPAILAAARAWAARFAEPKIGSWRAHANNLDPDRVLRIGLVSPDFRWHPVGRFLMPWLANFDRSRLQIICYADVVHPDSATDRLRADATQWRNICGMPDAALAEQIRADQIDILLDLTLHSCGNRLPMFALKPAPVQATYLAYCSTSGMTAMDYRLSDPYLDPPQSGAAQIYSEKTIRLAETYWCYEPTIGTLPITPLPALTNGYITFGCFNNFCKVSAPAWSAWRRLLTAVPNSHLRIHARPGVHRSKSMKFLADAGIAENRIHFLDMLPPDQYLQQYQQTDIALDPFPFNGGTTSCDAIWMGVPVVTLRGKTAVGRAGASILSNLKLEELIAETIEQYISIATNLANDLPRLSNLRETLRERMQRSPLMDAKAFARDMEIALRQMWRETVGKASEKS
jgi:protein O-GlcNAc transferase